MASELEQIILPEIGRNYFFAGQAMPGKRTYPPPQVTGVVRNPSSRISWEAPDGRRTLFSGRDLLIRLTELVPYAAPSPEISRINCTVVAKMGALALKRIDKRAREQDLSQRLLSDIQDYLFIIHSDLDQTFRAVIDITNPAPKDLKALAYLEANATLLNQAPINKV